MKLRLFLSLFLIGAISPWGWANDELDKQFHRYLLITPNLKKSNNLLRQGPT